MKDIKGMLKAGGGWESFQSRLQPADRQKEHARWQDAVQRSYDLQVWDPIEKKDHKAPQKARQEPVLEGDEEAEPVPKTTFLSRFLSSFRC